MAGPVRSTRHRRESCVHVGLLTLPLARHGRKRTAWAAAVRVAIGSLLAVVSGAFAAGASGGSVRLFGTPKGAGGSFMFTGAIGDFGSTQRETASGPRALTATSSSSPSSTGRSSPTRRASSTRSTTRVLVRQGDLLGHLWCHRIRDAVGGHGAVRGHQRHVEGDGHVRRGRTAAEERQVQHEPEGQAARAVQLQSPARVT